MNSRVLLTMMKIYLIKIIHKYFQFISITTNLRSHFFLPQNTHDITLYRK